MAKRTYGCYLKHEGHPYTITTTGDIFVEDISFNEAMAKPGIKMTIKKLDTPLSETFNASDNPYNHPELINNLSSIVADDFPGWQLAGTNISVSGIYLRYVTCHDPVPGDEDDSVYGGKIVRGDGVVYAYFNKRITLLFVVKQTETSCVLRYHVKCTSKPAKNGHGEINMTTIKEFINGHKVRKLKMREDEHGMPHINGQQYCVITEY